MTHALRRLQQSKEPEWVCRRPAEVQEGVPPPSMDTTPETLHHSIPDPAAPLPTGKLEDQLPLAQTLHVVLEAHMTIS